MAENTPNPISVAKALKGIDFPSDKAGLLEHARSGTERDREGAVGVIERLPDRQYTSMADVEKAVGHEI